METGRITCKQLIVIVFISRTIIAINYLPVLYAPPANQDVWLSVLLMFPIQVLLSLPVYFLWKMFPDQTLIQHSETILGKAGKILGFLYIWLFIQFTAVVLVQFAQFLTTAVMPETPLPFFIVSLMVFSAYTVGKGLEVIGRMAEIIAPVIMFALLSIFALLFTDMDFKALTPMLEKGFFPSLYGGLYVSSLTLEVLGMGMVLPCLNDRKKAKTVFLLSYLCIILFFGLITITVLTTFGAEMAKSHIFPFFSAVRLVNAGDFLERIEAIHIGIWTLGTFIKISFYYYLSVLGLGQLLNLKDHKPLILPTGTVIIPLSILIAPNIVELQGFMSHKIFTWYALLFILLIPSILLMITLIRRKGERPKCQSASSPG